ncbi:uncharacterized protein LOC123918461 [Trifolium pratense]|uniref:Uncharacterized protein n=1 Tax=Trifolium pratense TaxID=57577 RepID=A0ACB0J4K7_TRIPR|nr:uncharacterized protein LOC123918461 [Trifolium pratense]CAJ2639013.1 unnamed protein product [Trifolium pratense]
MATLFLISNPIFHTTNSFTFPSLRTPPSRNSPPPLLHASCRRPRSATVVTRAGANASSYAFAIALPLSLLAVTVFTALRIGQKLDQDFYEEMAKNEAIMEIDEDEEDDNDVDVETYLEEEPVLPRGRNRPKREA